MKKEYVLLHPVLEVLKGKKSEKRASGNDRSEVLKVEDLRWRDRDIKN